MNNHHGDGSTTLSENIFSSDICQRAISSERSEDDQIDFENRIAILMTTPQRLTLRTISSEGLIPICNSWEISPPRPLGL